jgi:hypothetical protein
MSTPILETTTPMLMLGGDDDMGRTCYGRVSLPDTSTSPARLPMPSKRAAVWREIDPGTLRALHD